MPDKQDSFTEKRYQGMIKPLLDFFYPRRCVLCHSHCSTDNPAELDLCADCLSDLPSVSGACLRCGIPLPDEQHLQICGQCQKKLPYFDHVISIYHYQNPVIWLVQQMKFGKKQVFAHLLGQLMQHSLQQQNVTLPDAIIPVPLHHKRLFQRGFNQSEEIARVVAKGLHCQLDTHLIERHISSQQQSGLNAKQRRKNVKGIFRIKSSSTQQYRHVAVIDDVMSTGSTVNEIAKTLKQQGIQRVDIWILARADHDFS